MRRLLTWAAAAALVLLATAPGVPAREATGSEVRKLASEAAAGGERALASLRDVDRVEGRAFPLARVLDADGADLRSRLRALAVPPQRSAGDAAASRGAARDILREERFHEPSFPRPLQPVFSWIAGAVDPVVDEVDGLLDWIFSLVPGGGPVGISLLALVLVLAFAAASSRMLRRRSRRRASSASIEAAVARGPSPSELERAAADAERAGDLGLAVRLRFRAGLLRLDERGAIRLRPSLTTAAIARRLDSPGFTELAAGFEEVAYGGRPAMASDVEAQRSGWRGVLEEVRR